MKYAPMFGNHKKVFYFSTARYSKMLSIVKTDLDFVKFFCNFVVTGSRKHDASIPAIFFVTEIRQILPKSLQKRV